MKVIEIVKDQYMLAAQKSPSVFTSANWLAIYRETLKFYGVFEEDNLVGGFYIKAGKKFGFNYWRLPPYTPHCGFFINAESKNPSVMQSKVKQITEAVAEYCNHSGNSLIVLAMPVTITDMQPFIWRGFKVIPNYTYHIDLKIEIAQIISHFDPKNRNMINKTIKEGVIATNELGRNDNLFAFYRMHLLEAGANVYEEELKELLDNFAYSEHSFTITAMKDDTIVGRVTCAFDVNTCYYLLGATDRKIQGVNNFLVLKAIEKAQSLGCKVFDFEGSMIQGVEKFFRGFGGKLVPFFTFNKASIPAEILLKFRKRHIF